MTQPPESSRSSFDGSDVVPASASDELRKRRVIEAARQRAAQASNSDTETHEGRDSDTGSGQLEVRCPGCHEPIEVAVDTTLTDLTCTACGSHFSLVDQTQATRMAPSLTKMGRFELIERIGVGGFGSVWKARDKQLDRTVAVKIPRAGGMTSEEQEKFFREARAAAQLKHPSIVSVHEVGRDGDSIYIVSDFVRGVTLGDWLTGQQLSSREAAELCAKIADALHHAHEHGVVHRDLKPANIMIDGDGQPHLMDFGLARREVGEVTVTMDGQVLGTPAYMSPEQAAGEAHTADRRSDVYSLGVIFFQLLTGELPFRGNARMIMHQVIHENPPSPRQFNSKIHKDLETITLKCLEKEPERRYASAQALGEDLRRFLAGEPIHARPSGALERSWLWCRRNPARLMAYSNVLLLIILVPVLILIYSVRAQRHRAVAAEREAVQQRDLAVNAMEEEERQRQMAQAQVRVAIEQKGLAEQAKLAEEYQAYIAHIGLAAAKINDNAFNFALGLLNQCKPEFRNWEWGRLVHLCHLNAGAYPTAGPVDAVDVSPDGRQFASGDWGGELIVRNFEDGKEAFRAKLGQYVHAVAYSPDGQQLAAGSSDHKVYVLNASTGAIEKTLQSHYDGVTSVAFSPDGRQLLSGSFDTTAVLWDVASGKPLQTLRGHSWWVWEARFTPDGNRIVTAGQDGKAIVWQKQDTDPSDQEAASYTILTEFTGHEGSVYAAAFSPDGKSVVTGGYDGCVTIWNPELVQPEDVGDALEGRSRDEPKYLRLPGHRGPVRCVAFSPNGQLALSGGDDNTIRIWEVASGSPGPVFRGHGAAVRSCAFSPDGQLILSGGQEKDGNQVRLWNIAGYQEVRVLHAAAIAGHIDAVLSARFSRDGKQIVTASRDRTASLWDAETGARLQQFQEGHDFLATSVSLFPDGKRLATGAGDNSVRTWDIATGGQLSVLAPTGRLGTLAISPDGTQIATGNPGHEVVIWDAESGTPVVKLTGHVAEVSAIAYSADGARLATGDGVGRLHIWQRGEGADHWTHLRELKGHTDAVTGIRFTHNNGRLITASDDHTCAQWDLAKGEELSGLVLQHPAFVSALDLSADGTSALTVCDDGSARIWNLDDAKVIHSIRAGDIVFNSAQFAPDAKSAILASSLDRSIRRWDFAAPEPQQLQPLLDLKQTGGLIWRAIYDHAGQNVVTVGGNVATLWRLDTGRPVVRFSPHGAVASADLAPDGKSLVTASWDHSAKIWDVATGRVVRKLDGGHTGYVNSAVYSPDGREVLTASDDGTARLWDAASGKLSDVAFAGHANVVLGATFSPDGSKVLTVSKDKSARVWDRTSGKLLLTLSGHRWGLHCGQFSGDGTQIVTGGEDNLAIVWDAKTGFERVRLAGHLAAVTSVAFSPDGTRVATGSDDNTVKIWDPSTGKEILSLAGHRQEVTSVAFSPNGRLVLSGSRDGTALIWLAADWKQSLDMARVDLKKQRRQGRHFDSRASRSSSVNQAEPFVVSLPDSRSWDLQCYEPYVRAQQYATELETTIALAEKDNDHAAKALGRLRDLCAQQVDHVRRMTELGRWPYTEEYFLSVESRYYHVSAELAQISAQKEEELAALKLGAATAEKWRNVWRSHLDNSFSPEREFVLEAVDQSTWFQIRQAELDNNKEATLAILRDKVKDLHFLWQAALDRFNRGRVGGEPSTELFLRARLLEAVAKVAEATGDSRSIDARALGFQEGPLPNGVSQSGVTLLQLSNLANQSAELAVNDRQTAFEENRGVSVSELEAANELQLQMKEFHAEIVGDPAALVDIHLQKRNHKLMLWRSIFALSEMGRSGGEPEKEIYARSEFEQAHARLMALKELDSVDQKKMHQPVSLSDGMLPHGFDPTSANSAYESALKSAEELVAHIANHTNERAPPLRQGRPIDEYSVRDGSYCALRVVHQDGTESEGFRIRDQDLNNLPATFDRLPDNRYRIYLVDHRGNSMRLVIELDVRNGRVVDVTDDTENARDRPPTS